MNERSKPNSAAWQPIAAAVCFLCAVFTLAIGFVLTTGWLLDAQLHPFLHGIGIFLLIVGLPILFLSGHFMDLRDRKIEQSKSHGQDNKHVHVLVGLVAFMSLVCVSSVAANAQQTTRVVRFGPWSIMKNAQPVKCTPADRSDRVGPAFYGCSHRLFPDRHCLRAWLREAAVKELKK